MINLIPVLSTILPIIASGLLLFVFTINIYCRIRRKFPICVNCWFCNNWTKVHYEDKNSFDCPTCLQYNGFTKDGDYNKIIPEQRDELLNKSTRIKNTKSPPSNGLCTLCNNNQQLKIIQLAKFIPLNEENYDLEIEHFQEQLEKAYKLCRKCDKVLKKTIDKQNAWIFGNCIKNGITASLQKVSSQINKKTKLSLLSLFNGTLSAITVILLLFIILSNVKYVTKTVSKYLPKAYLPVFKDIISLTNPPRSIKIDYLAQYDLKIEPFVFVSCFGLFLQFVGTIFEKYSTTEKLNRLLCWTILILTSWIRFHKIYAPYILTVQVFCCVYLLYTSFNKEEKYRPKPNTRFMRKVVKNLEHTCSMTDLSDTSDIEDVSSSSKKSFSQDSSDLSNKSNYSNRVPVQNHTANNVLNCTDLNKSLNNLKLGDLDFKSNHTFSVASLPLKRPKPVLSPPKFQTINSWVAGGFWRNVDGVIMPVAQRTNLSRSSSESSGFGSQHNDNYGFVLPQKNQFQGEFDRMSMHSEFVRSIPSPNYYFSPISKPCYQNYPLQGGFGRPPSFAFSEPVNKFNESYQRFQNWSDKVNSQATQNFRDLSLHSNYH